VPPGPLRGLEPLWPRPGYFDRAGALKEWLTISTEYAVVIIDAMALVIIVVGTVEAFVNGLRVMLSSPSGHERRDVWLRYARWLVAGLTFQLAGDIIETAVAPTWQDIGRLAAIAVIRTFLNYYLERDLAEVRKRQHEDGKETCPPAGSAR
jgi:uncharacterized membrane protein